MCRPQAMKPEKCYVCLHNVDALGFHALTSAYSLARANWCNHSQVAFFINIGALLLCN